MLHGLQHPGHLAPDVVRAVPVDDPCDPAHYGSTSRYSSRSQSVTAAR
jgi:hypothetical protein